MSEHRNTLLPAHLRASDRRQAEQVASISDPRYPATGTTRISALLAAAKEREYEERLAAARSRTIGAQATVPAARIASISSVE